MDSGTHMIDVVEPMVESDEEDGELLGQDQYPIEYPPVDPKIMRAVRGNPVLWCVNGCDHSPDVPFLPLSPLSLFFLSCEAIEGG